VGKNEEDSGHLKLMAIRVASSDASVDTYPIYVDCRRWPRP
jgi:hypothetical protein